MYGPWILAIMFGSLMVVCVAILFIAFYEKERNDKLYQNSKWGSEEKCKYMSRSNAWDDVSSIFLIAAMVCVTITILVCIFGGINLLLAKQEILRFEETRLIVEDAYRNGTDLDNIGMTHVIIDRNNWLANAKVKVSLYGNFSAYYGKGVETMEYISVGGVL